MINNLDGVDLDNYSDVDSAVDGGGWHHNFVVRRGGDGEAA